MTIARPNNISMDLASDNEKKKKKIEETKDIDMATFLAIEGCHKKKKRFETNIRLEK